MNYLRVLLIFFVLLWSGCAAVLSEPESLVATLVPGEIGGERSLKWSPKAASVSLQPTDSTLTGHFSFGSESSHPITVKLEKSAASEFYDVLWIDANRDSTFSETERFETTPKEVRYAMWSSFEAVIDVPVTDSLTGETIVNPYPMSLWYVQDLREAQTEHALRFTRRGWMQGRVMIDGQEAHIRISEDHLDGIFTLEDGWTLAEADSFGNIFKFEQERPGKRHAWLGEKAYKLVSVHPNGRTAYLEATDPGVTRAQEALDDDQLAVDRRAAHSGRSVSFLTDFTVAERKAREERKTLFIDFETVWCGPCKTMEEWVYTADLVVEAAETVIAVKVDGDDHPEIVKRFGVVGYPTMIKVSPDGEITGKLIGYQGVEAMAAFLSP